MKIIVLWDTELCWLVEFYQGFRKNFYLYIDVRKAKFREKLDSMSLRNAGTILSPCTALRLRRPLTYFQLLYNTMLFSPHLFDSS